MFHPYPQRTTPAEALTPPLYPPAHSFALASPAHQSLALSYFVTGLQFTGLTTLVGIIMKEKVSTSGGSGRATSEASAKKVLPCGRKRASQGA
jgi:hypothetical protein